MQRVQELETEVKEKASPKKKVITKENRDEKLPRPKRHCAQMHRWSREEDEVYMRFIKMNQRYFESEGMRRGVKIFVLLSQTLNGHRSPNQCKSHHQKMQKAVKGNGTVNGIISFLRRKYGLPPVVMDQKQKAELIGTKQYLTEVKERKQFLEIKIKILTNDL